MVKVLLFLFSLLLFFAFFKKPSGQIFINQFLISNISYLENFNKKSPSLKWTQLQVYKQQLQKKNKLLKKNIFYKKINRLWQADIKNLKAQNILPKQWSQIKSLWWKNKTDAQLLKAPVILNKQGHFYLKIYSFLLNQDYSALVIQINLVNSKNQNMLWELSRTFRL